MDFIRNLQIKLTTYHLRLTTKMAILLVLFMATFSYAQEIWMAKDGSIRSDNTRAVIVDVKAMYLATDKELYKSSSNGDKWEPIFFLSAGENEINCIATFSRNIFIGTKRGLFRSSDHGKTWQNVFRTFSAEKNDILSIAAASLNGSAGRIIIGTRSGIFSSDSLGDKWKNISANIKNKAARCLLSNGAAIYAGCDDGLYILKEPDESWKRVIVKSVTEKPIRDEPKDTSEEPEEDEGAINCIALKDNNLYAGIGKRIFLSTDGGVSWSSFSSQGLNGEINSILPSAKSDKIYCATTKGVFQFGSGKGKDEFKKESWVELNKGMKKNFNILKLAFDSKLETYLWAVADKGVYRLESDIYYNAQYIDVEKNMKELKVVYDNEPSLKEAQKAALKYAEISPEKIAKWRQEARLRALLPKVSLGLDNNRSNTAEIYTSATKDYIIQGPDDVTKGWDVSIAWELGDLIWSDDQTNIDVRSRLTTQLRNDVLDDLRRVYFERKRVQFELMTNPPQDIKAKFEKEMKLAELTQGIDDLTGNYFSEHMKK